MEEQSQRPDVADWAHFGYTQESPPAYSSEWATGVECGLAAPVCIRDAGCILPFGPAWNTAHIPLVDEMPHNGSKQSGNGMSTGILSRVEYARITHDMASHD